MAVRTPDIVRAELEGLHRTAGLSWRQIAQMPGYQGIPPGTLCAIALGYDVPKKWRHHFGLREFKEAPACEKCGRVHVIDGVCPDETPVRIVRKRTTVYRDLFAMPPAALRRALEAREEV